MLLKEMDVLLVKKKKILFLVEIQVFPEEKLICKDKKKMSFRINLQNFFISARGKMQLIMENKSCRMTA